MKPDKDAIQLELVHFFSEHRLDPYRPAHQQKVMQMLAPAFNRLINKGLVKREWYTAFLQAAQDQYILAKMR